MDDFDIADPSRSTRRPAFVRAPRDWPRLGEAVIWLWLAGAGAWIGAAYFGRNDFRRWPERNASTITAVALFVTPFIWTLLDLGVKALLERMRDRNEPSGRSARAEGQPTFFARVGARLFWSSLALGASLYVIPKAATVITDVVFVAVGVAWAVVEIRGPARRKRRLRYRVARVIISAALLMSFVLGGYSLRATLQTWAERREVQLLKEPGYWVDVAILDKPLIVGPNPANTLGERISRRVLWTVVVSCPNGEVFDVDYPERLAVGDRLDSEGVQLRVALVVRMYNPPMDAESTHHRVARYCDELLKSAQSTSSQPSASRSSVGAPAGSSSSNTSPSSSSAGVAVTAPGSLSSWPGFHVVAAGAAGRAA